ncbi:hypothetical protein BC833DRAFT_582707 [Globomyces pollinis-pini]|nr:hypothetical protein BC833DRAFT_582707 [Globomyces pollinis-pini]
MPMDDIPALNLRSSVKNNPFIKDQKLLRSDSISLAKYKLLERNKDNKNVEQIKVTELFKKTVTHRDVESKINDKEQVNDNMVDSTINENQSTIETPSISNISVNPFKQADIKQVKPKGDEIIKGHLNQHGKKAVNMLDILRNFDSVDRKEQVLYRSSERQTKTNTIESVPKRKEMVIASHTVKELNERSNPLETHVDRVETSIENRLKMFENSPTSNITSKLKAFANHVKESVNEKKCVGKELEHMGDNISNRSKVFENGQDNMIDVEKKSQNGSVKIVKSSEIVYENNGTTSDRRKRFEHDKIPKIPIASFSTPVTEKDLQNKKSIGDKRQMNLKKEKTHIESSDLVKSTNIHSTKAFDQHQHHDGDELRQKLERRLTKIALKTDENEQTTQEEKLVNAQKTIENVQEEVEQDAEKPDVHEELNMNIPKIDLGDMFDEKDQWISSLWMEDTVSNIGMMKLGHATEESISAATSEQVKTQNSPDVNVDTEIVIKDADNEEIGVFSETEVLESIAEVEEPNHEPFEDQSEQNDNSLEAENDVMYRDNNQAELSTDTLTENAIVNEDEVDVKTKSLADLSSKLKKSVSFGVAWKGELEKKRIIPCENLYSELPIDSVGKLLFKFNSIDNIYQQNHYANRTVEIEIIHGYQSTILPTQQLSCDASSLNLDWEPYLYIIPNEPIVINLKVTEIPVKDDTVPLRQVHTTAGMLRHGLSTFTSKFRKSFSRPQHPSHTSETVESNLPHSSSYSSFSSVSSSLAFNLKPIPAQKPGTMRVGHYSITDVASWVSNSKGHINQETIEMFDNDWDKSKKSYRKKATMISVGSLSIQTLYMPLTKTMTTELLPLTISEYRDDLLVIKLHEKVWKEGYLLQLGGDCDTWRRRYFKLVGDVLIAYHEVTRDSRSRINLQNLDKIQYGSITCEGESPDFILEFSDGKSILFKLCDDVDDSGYIRDGWINSIDESRHILKVNSLPGWYGCDL